MPAEPDLDATIAALKTAVESGDRPAIATHLATIEAQLQTMNPLLRGMTYAHVKSVMGEPAEAVAVVEDLLELMPDHGIVYYQLGCYRRAAGDSEGALVAFSRATELDPSLADAWINRGVLLDARGEAEQAVEAYRQAMLRAPTEVDVWRNLGDGLAALGHFDEALEAYRTATRLRPDDSALAALVSSAYQAKGELEQANGSLPAAVREERGPVQEVRRESGTRVLCCRFHARPEQDSAYREAARTLLDAAASVVHERDEEDFPVAHEGALLVWHAGLVLLCDVDPGRSGLPHRFFDASATVARAIADASPSDAAPHPDQ